jgi:hypothetical protein
LLQQKRLQQQQQIEEQRYERERQDRRADFTFEQDYRTQHPLPPQPTEYERALAAAGIAPGSPEYTQHMKSYVDVKENPPRFMEVPGVGLIQVPTVPSAPIGKLTPLRAGGPTSGSGSFR